jgi:hypothetical protein
MAIHHQNMEKICEKMNSNARFETVTKLNNLEPEHLCHFKGFMPTICASTVGQN